MRISAMVVCGAALAAGCASRESAPTSEVARAKAPLNYETTVTTYFDLTTHTPPAQRKLQFGAPESTPCRVLGGNGGPLGWVVPVTYEVTAPPAPAARAAPAAAAAAATPAAAQVAKAGAAPAKGKPAVKAKPKVAAAAADPAPVMPVAITLATPSASDLGTASLDNVSVIGKTRYFFWFDRETINAVTKRMDICP